MAINYFGYAPARKPLQQRTELVHFMKKAAVAAFFREMRRNQVEERDG